MKDKRRLNGTLFVMGVIGLLFMACRKEPVETGLVGKWEIRQLDSVRQVDSIRLDTFVFCGSFREKGWIQFRIDSFGFISNPVRMATCGENRFIWESQKNDTEILFFFFEDTTRAWIQRTDNDHMIMLMRNFYNSWATASPVFYRYDLARMEE